jgi:hypothetical protein
MANRLKNKRQKLQLSRLEKDAQLLSKDLDLTDLAFITRRLPNMKFSEAVTDGEVIRTIEGASTVTIEVTDPYGLIKNSGRLAREVDIKIDGLWFRLVAFRKTGTKTNLTFESREVAILRTYDNKRIAAWGQLTRARFAQILVNEVKQFKIPFVCPELKKTKFEKDKAKEDKLRDRNPGFGDWPSAIAMAASKGKPITIKGRAPVTAQLEVIEKVLDVGHNLSATGRLGGVTRKILVCAIMTIIQEATAYNKPFGHGTSVGAFQLIDIHGTVEWRMNLNNSANWFYERAVKFAQDHPNAQYAEICQGAQRSAFPDAYSQWRVEAERLVTAYGIAGGANSSNSDTAAANNMGDWQQEAGVDDFQFMRGRPKTLPGGKKGFEKENSWDCLNRLAEEVHWRCFEVSGRVYFISEPYLFRSAPRMRISESTEGVDWVDFDYDINKKNGQITVTCNVDRWAAPPGSILEIFDSGIANGRWLITDIRRPIHSIKATITLKKPRPKLPEPKKDDLTGIGDYRNTKEYSPTPGYSPDPPGQYPSGNALRDAVLNSPNITFSRTSQSNDIKFGLVKPQVLKFMLAFSEAGFPIKVTSMRSDHSANTSSGNPSAHGFGLALDMGNYGSDNPRTPTAMRWIADFQPQLGFSQLIGPNNELVIPLGHYDKKTLEQHDDHIHVGWHIP